MKNPENDIVISLSPSKIVKIMKDPVKSAKAVSLVYTRRNYPQKTRKKIRVLFR